MKEDIGLSYIDVGDGRARGAIAPLENFTRAKLIRTGQGQVMIYIKMTSLRLSCDSYSL